VIRTVSAPRNAGALALFLVLLCAGVPGAVAAEPSPADPSPRIVPAVRYGEALDGQDEGILAPRASPLLAWYQDEAPPGGLAVAYTSESRESFPIVLLDERGKAVSRGTSFRWGTGWLSLIGVPATARPGRTSCCFPSSACRSG